MHHLLSHDCAPRQSAVLLLFTLLMSPAACTNVSSAIPPAAVVTGERPLSLAEALSDSNLKQRLLSCALKPSQATEFSISHRGAPSGYPEHTQEGYIAAAQMGAGIIECDVTFTKDGTLVCRHSQCDLHRTTNILQTELAAQCTAPFTPATQDKPANAKCCTSDITLKQYRSLCGRRDVVNERATGVDDYLTTPANDLVTEPVTCGTLMTHAESIALIDSLGRNFIPELKRPEVKMPFNGMSQNRYATRMLEEYTAAGIAPERVHPQSFSLSDIEYWIAHHPEFANQAIYLDPRGRQSDFTPTLDDMMRLKAAGVTTLAPPMVMLLTLDEEGELQASEYARLARQAGLDLITWTFESGDPTSPDNWLYANVPGYVDQESRILEVLHALHTKAGIKGIFSNWPGTVTYYANCFDL